jgi:1,4-alpha-glucan branching enzyme
MLTVMNAKEHMKLILKARHHDPFEFLGPHSLDSRGVLVRAFLPEARRAWVVREGKAYGMERIDAEGFFEALFVDETRTFPYRIMLEDRQGSTLAFQDPYSFPPILSDFDLHLISEGTHYKKYEKLGAHIKKVRGAKGVHFAVWAPNAKGMSVIGNFNRWDGRRHPMRLRSGGIWELFIPEVGEGDLYKYELRTAKDTFIKTDPYGFYAEVRPKTASIVWNISKYRWRDGRWMRKRRIKNWLESPMAVYEVHLGSWMRDRAGGFLSYRELAHKLVDYVKKMGYTHLELLPVMEHPLDASWGYQTIGYFSITSRSGQPEDFMYFVDHCHQNGIGVIMDWVPAHFPKDAHGLAYFDGTYLYEHEHPHLREHKDWGTHIFNYGRNEVANFLLNSALFWLEKYHIDGLRVDAVASMLYLDYSRARGEWIPNKYGGNENLDAIAFLKRFNELCHKYHPGVLTIAEESTAWPMVSRPTYVGGLGFSMKWNMGWMHDVLSYFSCDPIHRKYHHNNLTFGLVYAFHENFVLVLSHDEVVHEKRSVLDKMPGDLWQKFANLRLLYGFMYGHPGKKMLFMGGEIGQWKEWDFDSSLNWQLLQYEPHQKLQRYLQELNRLYSAEPAMYEVDFDYGGFEWIDFSDSEASVVSFMRKAKYAEDFLVFVYNFTPVPRGNYRIGVPRKMVYREVMNSDSADYWGSNVGNAGLVMAEGVPVNQWPCSLRLTLPPLGMLVLKPQTADLTVSGSRTPPADDEHQGKPAKRRRK